MLCIMPEMTWVAFITYAESLFIEIDNTYTHNTVIGVIYRPPDQNINEFNKYW